MNNLKIFIFFLFLLCSNNEDDKKQLEKVPLYLKNIIYVRGLKRVPVRVLFKAYEGYIKLHDSCPNKKKNWAQKVDTRETNFPKLGICSHCYPIYDYFCLHIESKMVKVFYYMTGTPEIVIYNYKIYDNNK